MPLLTSRSGKPTVRLKIRLFHAACISILLYGCESWVMTVQQLEKLDVYARTCYRSMLGIRQSEAHMTNERLYALTGQRPISESIRVRQLTFTGHCLRMDSSEPANIFALYTSDIMPAHRRGAPKRQSIFARYLTTYAATRRCSSKPMTSPS